MDNQHPQQIFQPLFPHHSCPRGSDIVGQSVGRERPGVGNFPHELWEDLDNIQLVQAFFFPGSESFVC